MACNWIYKNNEIVGVKGNPSIFKELEEKFGLEEAVALYTVSQSDAFQEIFGGQQSETSINYSNLTEDSQGNFVFYHVGDRGYKTIKKGTGQNITTSREEATAISRVGGLAMYYPAENVGETMIVNNTKYIVKVPKNKVYDFNADPLNFLEQAEEAFRKEYPNQAFDTNSQLAFVTKVANEKGFDAVVAKWKDTTRVQTTKELKPVDSQLLEGNTIVKDFLPKNKLKSNKEKGWKSQEGRTQKQVLSETYKKISDIIGNDYSNPLYRLRDMSSYTFEDRFSPFKSQDEITNTIQNSNIPQNLKDEYLEALSFTDTKGYSFLGESYSAEDIVNFVTAENENKKPLSKEQKADFRNMLKDIPNFNKQSFIDAFYVDGLFIITDKLQPFYSRYEVQNLKNDVQLQAKVKNAVEALKNTEEEIEATAEQVEKINEINSFGKLINYNPQKEIQEALAGIQDRDEFDEALNNLPFPNFLRTVNRDELFEKMSGMQRVEVYSELNGQIIPQPQEFVEPLLALKKDEIDFELVDNIDFLLETPQDVLDSTQEATAKILEEIVEQGANSAIDLQGLTLDKPFLEEFRMFILGENPNFVEVYKTFFNKNQEVKTAVKKIKKEQKDYVELNTTLTEEEVYNQQGLIKAQDNLWIKTAKQPLEELYPILETYNPNIREEIQTQIAQLEGFNNAETAEAVMLYKNYFGVNDAVTVKLKNVEKDILDEFNDEVVGKKEVRNYEIDFENGSRAFGTIDGDKAIITQINAPKQEGVTLRGQNTYVNVLKQLKKLGVNSVKIRLQSTDSREAIKRLLSRGVLINPREFAGLSIDEYPTLFDININEKQSTTKVSNFTGNYEYLTTDFLKDFYAKMLKERNKNSATWKNFYSNFGINERGLYLNTEDLETIKDYADENLKQYSLISKQLPNLIETETEIINRRDEAINNPQTVKKFEGQIFSIPTGEIIIKDSVEEFVRIGEDIYENVDAQGNLSLYTKLPKNNSPYYKVGEKQIETEVKLSDYNYLQNKTDKFTTVKNYLTKEEKEEVNNNFIC